MNAALRKAALVALGAVGLAAWMGLCLWLWARFLRFATSLPW